jgi:hypothetical protein
MSTSAGAEVETPIDYQTHAGQRLGHWPSSPEIAAAMFEGYARKRDSE